MNLSPIILFTYNRPYHTEQTLEALRNNELADESVLYIYADGPKPNASEEQLDRIQKVRQLIRKKQWCKEVHIIESKSNKGLDNSIIPGITEIINKCGKIIVLEDDIVTSKGFLQYMNAALQIYEPMDKVAGISGYNFIEAATAETYFSRAGGNWGWGTWKRVWDKVDWDIDSLLQKIGTKETIKTFNIEGAYPYYDILKGVKMGLTGAWDIRFYASYFFNEQLFLLPSKSMVLNIGTDEGTHYKGKKTDINKKNFLLKNQEVTQQEILEDEINKNILIRYHLKNRDNIIFRLLKKYMNKIKRIVC